LNIATLHYNVIIIIIILCSGWGRGGTINHGSNVTGGATFVVEVVVEDVVVDDGDGTNVWWVKG
jgi:hypothetical protein